MRPATADPSVPLPDPRNVPGRFSPATGGRLSVLADRVEELAPAPVLQLVQRTRAAVRAAAHELIPLPLVEVWKLGSLDPFVARATTFSQRASGRHFLFLAGVPMTDSGGGRRPAQLALALLERGHRVSYVYRFPSREYGRRRRSFAHPNLTHVRFDEFSALRFAAERASRERLVVLCEMPLAEYRGCLRYLRERGAQTVYDCYDDWESALGGKWYSRRVEERLLLEVDAITASARGLRDALAARSGRDVALLPNAFNPKLFDPAIRHDRPADLPRGKALFTYVGALWGDWIAWDWVIALARANPEAQVVLIGDHRGQRPEGMANLPLLGLRSQAEIPAYLQHSDVCLVPHDPARQSRTANPLTVYEYLAMGKPVVAADLPELRELPGVLLAANGREFVAQVDRALRSGRDEAALERFAATNAWKVRVRQLERLLGV